MANQEHLDILMQGVDVWNEWRKEHPDIQPDLSFALLIGANLSEADFHNAYLRETTFSRPVLNWAIILDDLHMAHEYLSGANLSRANLSGADLRNAHLSGVDLTRADLSFALLIGANLQFGQLYEADLHETDLRFANLSGANLSRANLSKSHLDSATLIKTNLEQANLTDSSVYGISAWNIELKETIQSNLIITDSHEPMITLDNLEVAQFIYLLLNNKKIRDVIDTITSKVVLILGRFTPERKIVLDAIRDELRKRNYLPILFDFEKPVNRDLTETVSTLAHLARFIIVDLTDPSSAPHEVATIIPQTVVPVQPLLLREPLMIDGKVVERREYAMFEDLRQRYSWVLPTVRYQDATNLFTLLKEQIIDPAERKAQELAKR